MNVWINPLRPPTTTDPEDQLELADAVGNPVPDPPFILDTENSTPPLEPGGRYFVGIENPGPNAVTIAYVVDFDVTPLTEGVPYNGTLGTNTFGGKARMFSYDVSMNNPTALSFDLFNLTGNANLTARFEAFPEDPFVYDYRSSNLGTNAETITVLPDSTPVPLTPGRWYIEVTLDDAPPVDYTLLVTEYTNDFSGIITLTNATPYSNTNNGVMPIEDYYRFTVTDPVARLQFEIFGASLDMTLLARKGLPLPDFANYDYLSANPGTNDEYILVLPDSSPVTATAGEWFLTAINLSGQAGNYQIVATQWPVSGQPIDLSPPQIMMGGFCFSWNSLAGAKYVIQGKVALGDPDWVDLIPPGTITATDVVTSYCVPLPSPYHFFRVVEGVAVDSSSAAQFRAPRISVGPGGVSLTWQAPPIFSFDVQYSDVLPPVWTTAPGGPITSTDGTFTFNDPPPLLPVRYYRLVLLP
ncbi:MAG: hypothetical protein MUC91_04500 [Verrucomicrobia bacterium]|nr:hypothetical protein [Verrucomicrobiota bacterium]